MKVTRTITVDGKSKAEYDKIVAHLEAESKKSEGWELIKEPLVHRVTATQTVEVESL